ncbi:MAG: acyltransferase family protein [Methanobrevibacter sp.]|nr:acyltransferase family protein [Methanobrevibacter sp.]
METSEDMNEDNSSSKNFNLEKLKKCFLSFFSFYKTNQNQTTNNKRVAKYDNLKGLAILIVIFVHVISPSRENGVDIYVTLANFLCIFAMPIFFFVGGYFSKISEDSGIKAFKNIFIPYILFTIIWLFFNYFVLGRAFHRYPFVVPAYALWFLISLFTIRLILPILDKIKHILPISILALLLIGLLPIPDDFFGYARTFGYLPVFLVGYYYNDYKKTFNEKIAKYSNLSSLFRNKISVFIMLILFIIIMWIFSDSVTYFESSYELVQFVSSYETMDLTIEIGIISRFIAVISGIIAALFVNKLMTNKVTFLTKLGVNSFTIYILHLYIVRFVFVKLRVDSPVEFIFNDPLLTGIYTIIMVPLISYIFSRDFITKKFNSFIKIFEKAIMHR